MPTIGPTAVVALVRDASGGLSAGETGERFGMSRVSARRYLEHLTDVGLVVRATRYGGTGRPEVEYRRRS
jgi:response regulator of citrate/malate metabolism